jgi:hypothetical protein
MSEVPVKIRPSTTALTWVALAGLLAALLGASWRALQPPAPLPADAPEARFSEGRAREIVRRLAGDIGFRINGTPEHARAAELLAGELRRIPGVEVEIQDVSGTQILRKGWYPAFVYRTLNVVARLPGRSPEALLLDAHFDTLADSVGAADDAAGVAAAVEAVRVLAREAPLEHTIIVNLNGGEESGVLGAAGFLKHRWARDVRAYLYLEALPAGRAGLYGAGPGNAWLAETYARVAPAPVGTVVGQDLMQSGLLPHDGDFTPFHDAGLHGLDVAMSGDGWAYHDGLDRPERLQQGSLQHMGDTAVAVARALASGPLPADRADAEGVVFYDFLGVSMAAYRARTGRTLAIAALILAAIALGLAWRRRVISVRSALGALAWTLLAVVAGVCVAFAAGLLLARVLGRPHGWFSAPALVLPAFAAPALAAMLGVQALWRRRALRRAAAEPDRAVVDRHAYSAWAGALLFWAVWLALATARHVGAGYLALHWVWPAAVAMIASFYFPRARTALALASLIPGAAVTLELGMLFLSYFIPIVGIIPAPQPFDVSIAVMAGAVAVAVAVLACAAVHRAGRFGRAALVCTAVAIAGLTASAIRFPYTAERPKRLRLAHVSLDCKGEQRSALLLRADDALGMASVLPSLPELVPARRDWPAYETWQPLFSHELPAPPPTEPPAPRIAVIHDAYDAATDLRELRLRVTAPGAQMRLAFPASRLVIWSLDGPPTLAANVRGDRTIHLEGLGADGAELSVTVRGSAPLPVELRSVARAPARDEAALELLRRLPPWTTTTSLAIHAVRLTL